MGKEFRVLHRHLYHFPDAHDLVAQPSYIFVGGDASGRFFVALYRLFPEFNVCGFRNQDNDICRVCLNSNKGNYLACCQGFSHWLRHRVYDRNYVSFEHRPLQDMPFYDLICVLPELQFGPALSHAFRKRQNKLFCFRSFYLFNGHFLPNGNTCILPDEVINAHDPLFPVLPVCPPYLCCGFLLPPNLHNVTGRELKFH